MSLARARKRAAATGRRGEKIAAGFLVSRGMTVLHRNFRCRAGELDIVALDGGEIVFVEVKCVTGKEICVRGSIFLPISGGATAMRARFI